SSQPRRRHISAIHKSLGRALEQCLNARRCPAAAISLVLLSRISSFAAAQCNDTHAQLKVAITLTEDEFNQNPFAFRRVVVRPSGNVDATNYTNRADYDYYENLADFEACVPKEGACLEVTVSDLPADSYEISWDGSVVETGRTHKGEFGSGITSTEIGDYCLPTCDDGEAVFEYQYWSSLGFEDYRVEDLEGNELFGCDNYQDDCQGDTFDTLHTYRECLPREGCYRYLVGDNFHRIPGVTDAESSHSLRWDGKPIAKAEGKLFDSVLFGEGCPASECGEDESLVELFVHRATSDLACDEEINLSWELSTYEDGAWAEADSWTFPGCADTSLYHEVRCIPKGQCAKFTVTSSKGSELVWPLYSLARDGVVYRRKELSYFDKLEETTFLGDSYECADAEALCLGEGEALMVVNVVAPDEYELDGKSVPAIPGGFDWARISTLASASNSSNVYFDPISTELGTTYRAWECVPDCEFEVQFEAEESLAEDTFAQEVNLFGCDDGGEEDTGDEGDGGSTGGSAAAVAFTSLAGVWVVLGSLALA
ncbi:hypothetical protein ACHAXT_000152, partial [Thalassiosira profunda]